MKEAIMKYSAGHDDASLACIKQNATLARSVADAMIEGPQVEDRIAALRTLAHVGNESSIPRIGKLLSALTEVDTDAQKLAVNGGYALAKIGKPAVPALLDLLEANNQAVANAAAGGLRYIFGIRFEFAWKENVEERNQQRKVVEEQLRSAGVEAQRKNSPVHE